MKRAAKQQSSAVRETVLAIERALEATSEPRTLFRDALTIAKERGLLKGTRTELVRGRMPKALVARAKARTGIKSDTKLIELALATVAIADEYADWLLSQRRTVSKDVNLEF